MSGGDRVGIEAVAAVGVDVPVPGGGEVGDVLVVDREAFRRLLTR